MRLKFKSFELDLKSKVLSFIAILLLAVLALYALHITEEYLIGDTIEHVEEK